MGNEDYQPKYQPKSLRQQMYEIIENTYQIPPLTPWAGGTEPNNIWILGQPKVKFWRPRKLYLVQTSDTSKANIEDIPTLDDAYKYKYEQCFKDNGIDHLNIQILDLETMNRLGVCKVENFEDNQIFDYPLARDDGDAQKKEWTILKSFQVDFDNQQSHDQILIEPKSEVPYADDKITIEYTIDPKIFKQITSVL